MTTRGQRPTDRSALWGPALGAPIACQPGFRRCGGGASRRCSGAAASVAGAPTAAGGTTSTGRPAPQAWGSVPDRGLGSGMISDAEAPYPRQPPTLPNRVKLQVRFSFSSVFFQAWKTPGKGTELVGAPDFRTSLRTEDVSPRGLTPELRGRKVWSSNRWSDRKSVAELRPGPGRIHRRHRQGEDHGLSIATDRRPTRSFVGPAARLTNKHRLGADLGPAGPVARSGTHLSGAGAGTKVP